MEISTSLGFPVPESGPRIEPILIHGPYKALDPSKMAMRSALILAAAASASALHVGGPTTGIPTAKLTTSAASSLLSRTAMPLKGAQLEHLTGGAPAEAKAGPVKLMLLILGWYGNSPLVWPVGDPSAVRGATGRGRGNSTPEKWGSWGGGMGGKLSGSVRNSHNARSRASAPSQFFN